MLRILIFALCIAGGMGHAAPCKAPPGYDAFKKTVVSMTNDYRKKKRRKALNVSEKLTEAAQSHACFMAKSGTFSHTGARGSHAQDRVVAAGYRWRFVAENIAMGQPFPQAAFSAWKKSPGHNRNMLHKRAREIGIGVALRDGRPYWVMVLGNRR